MILNLIVSLCFLISLVASEEENEQIHTIEHCNGWKQTRPGLYKLVASPNQHYQLCSIKFLAPAGQRIRIKLHRSSVSCVPGSFLALYDGWEMTSGRKRTPYFVPAHGPLRTLFVCPADNHMANLAQAETSQNFAELVYRVAEGQSLFAQVEFFDIEHDEHCDVFLTGEDYGKEFTIQLNGAGKKCKWYLPGNILLHIKQVNFKGLHENCSSGVNNLKTKSGVSWNDLRTWYIMCSSNSTGVYISPCKHSLIELNTVTDDPAEVTFSFEPAQLRMKILFDQTCIDTLR